MNYGFFFVLTRKNIGKESIFEISKPSKRSYGKIVVTVID